MIFNEEIPDPRDVIIVSLLITCNVLLFIFQLVEEASERIETICGVDLIARAISEAVANSGSKFVPPLNEPELQFVAGRL